jgi:isopentenyl diphosphate isomerase/L-lactate dehydrogenase-like FMN-dependent dehydrogenase
MSSSHDGIVLRQQVARDPLHLRQSILRPGLASKDIERALSFDDLRRLAQRRLPRILFELVEGGVEDEIGVVRNTQDFERHVIVPRFLVDVAERDQTVSVFGRRFASPVGIAPTGIAGLLRRGSESMLARAAKHADVPFILSGACMEQLETVGAIDPERTWYQLYAARDFEVSRDMMRRALQTGIRTLVLTVDGPVYPKRERDMRNGFGLPMKLRPRIVADVLRHPAWLFEYLSNGGLPMMQPWQKYAGNDATAKDVFVYFRTQSPSIQTWTDLDRFRDTWPGQLIVKGIQHPDDARLAVEAGVDGIIVSNHGGKVLDRGCSAIAALSGVVDAVGERTVVMMDSGIRRGSDAIIARCLGAQLVFAGRAPLYGVIAAGERGAAKALELFRSEIDTTLALIGCPYFSDLSDAFLLPAT